MQNETKSNYNNKEIVTVDILTKNQGKFELYKIWKSLPVIMLNKMRREDYLTTLGIDDPVVMELAQIKTQVEFASQYDLTPATLSEWNKKIFELDPLAEAKNWARPLVKNMVMALYMHAIKKGDAQLIKLYLQVVNDFNEKSTVEHDFPHITNFNISIAKKNNDVTTKESDGYRLGNDGKTGTSVRVPYRPRN